MVENEDPAPSVFSGVVRPLIVHAVDRDQRDVASGKTHVPLIGHSDNVYSLAFGPDGRSLAIGSIDLTAPLRHVVLPEPSAASRRSAGRGPRPHPGSTDGVSAGPGRWRIA
ncbi:hypothetical protein AB5J49_41625 [Streptomyces sp. R28]|uniref:Uncharacterized protein n=1 Tax=Streptomyces sp. R28 TaxID=3238628 RepID=A0AB39QE56_9ACTN